MTGSADSYFGLVTYNQVRSGTRAEVRAMSVDVTGDVTVSAADASSITATDSSVVTSWNGVGGVIVTNVVLGWADALLTRSPVTAGGDLLVEALQVAVVQLSFLNEAFGTAPLSLTDWLACVGLASVVLWADEAKKLLERALRA